MSSGISGITPEPSALALTSLPINVMAFVPARTTVHEAGRHEGGFPRWVPHGRLSSERSLTTHFVSARKWANIFPSTMAHPDGDANLKKRVHATSRHPQVRSAIGTSTSEVATSRASTTGNKKYTRGKNDRRISGARAPPDSSVDGDVNGKYSLSQYEYEFGNVIKAIPENDWAAVARELENLEAQEDAGGPAISAYIYSNCIHRMSKCRRGREALDMLARAEKRGVANM